MNQEISSSKDNEKVSSYNSNDDNLDNELGSMNIDSSSKNNNYTCLCCLKEVDGSLGCSQCLAARYCGSDCQAKHWPVHNNSCRDSNTNNNNDKIRMKAKNHLKQGNFIYNTKGLSLLIK